RASLAVAPEYGLRGREEPGDEEHRLFAVKGAVRWSAFLRSCLDADPRLLVAFPYRNGWRLVTVLGVVVGDCGLAIRRQQDRLSSVACQPVEGRQHEATSSRRDLLPWHDICSSASG